MEELVAGNDTGIGCVRRYTWKGRLPYRLTFDVRVTHMQLQTMVEGMATGDVEGFGRWEFESDGEATLVRYAWHVRPTLPWMRLLSPVADQAFRWNHDGLMRQGGEGLARRLKTHLLDMRLK